MLRWVIFKKKKLFSAYFNKTLIFNISNFQPFDTCQGILWCLFQVTTKSALGHILDRFRLFNLRLVSILNFAKDTGPVSRTWYCLRQMQQWVQNRYGKDLLLNRSHLSGNFSNQVSTLAYLDCLQIFRQTKVWFARFALLCWSFRLWRVVPTFALNM